MFYFSRQLPSSISACSLASILVLGLLYTIAVAAPNFPSLSDRVVDQANILSLNTEADLKRLLQQHENETSNQVVVVTLKSLEGYDIADYGYQLGRHWGIGHKDKDNGVLLIIAPHERKMRIEVGYGVEGTLTDALSSYIINQDIVPHFKQDSFDEGVLAGTKAIVNALNQEPNEYTPQPAKEKQSIGNSIFTLIPFFLPIIFLGEMFGSRKKGKVLGNLAFSGFFGLLAWAITTSIAISIGVPRWRRIWWRRFRRRRVWWRRRQFWRWWRLWRVVNMQHLNQSEKQEIRQAIREQEVHTTGEIVTVITSASDRYLYIPTLWAALLALLTPYILHLMHYQFQFLNSYPLIQLSKHLHISIYQVQLIVFCLFALLFRWPWLKMKLIPKSIKHSRASRLAHEQFYVQGLHSKKERTGVLLFVSVAEHYVELLADKSINDAVAKNTWESLIATFIKHVKSNNIKVGYVKAIEQAGSILRQHFPCVPEKDINELPDHLIEL